MSAQQPRLLSKANHGSGSTPLSCAATQVATSKTAWMCCCLALALGAAAAAASTAQSVPAVVPDSTNTTAAVPAAGNASSRASNGARLLRHNGKEVFLTGVNLGNVQFLPFEGNPYGYLAAELQGILQAGLAEVAATGANSIRFWLHIDGSRSPTWGPAEVSCTCVVGHTGVDNSDS